MIATQTGCGHESAAGSPFTPVAPGVLTVATAVIPSPGFWAAAETSRGYEAELAERLAARFGLGDVKVVQVPFARIAAGDLGGADVALTQMTPTKERERFVNFTTPYLQAPPGVVTRAGIRARDLSELRELRWVVVSSSTLTPVVHETIRPETVPVDVDTRAGALAAIDAGTADAVLLDLPVAQGIATAEPARYRVAGRLRGSEGLAAAVPEKSANLDAIDSAIRALRAQGTLDALESRWLGATKDVPLIRSRAEP